MKTKLALLAVVLVAAGCAGTTVTSRINPTPQGAEQSYLAVYGAVIAKCGPTAEIMYFYSQKNNYLGGHLVDSYEFSAGGCGTSDQLIGALYDRSTATVSVDDTPKKNPNGLLQPFPLSAWRVNSDQAVSAAMKGGGDKFLLDNPGGDMSIVGLSNREGQPFEWEIIFKSTDGSKTLAIHIDPTTGDIMN